MYLTLVFIVMIMSATFIILSIQDTEIKKAEGELRQFALIIYEQIVLTYADPDDFQGGFLDLNITENGIRSIGGNIIDKRGQTIASTMSSDRLSLPSYYNSVVSSALSGSESFSRSLRSTDKNGQVRNWLGYGYPVEMDGEVKYVVYTQIDKSDINLKLSQTRRTLMMAVLLALVLTCVLGLLFANTITGPISALTRRANSLAKGKLDQHITVKSDDEIGQLTKSFNYMAKELRKTLLTMEGEKNKLEIVINNMTDGVLAFDGNGVLIHANPIALEMFELENRYFSLSDFLVMSELNKDDLKLNEIYEITFIRGDKYIVASFIPYAAESEGALEGVVVVLHDITKLKMLDNMRKEFVANVSHEIRTPLTTIKSYAETLMDGALDSRETAMEFLRIIDSETDRMALLTQDLLELSSLDNNQFTFNYEIVNLIQLINESVRQNSLTAAKKNQKLIFRQPENNEMAVYVDPSRINQVINNIITNAMKYSNEKQSITIEVEEDIKNYYVLVSDKGIGIPKDDLKRVFERFYRVDKARSRSLGGTGLGLAIAKEIMEGHGGTIVAKSELQKGTTMILVFPRHIS